MTSTFSAEIGCPVTAFVTGAVDSTVLPSALMTVLSTSGGVTAPVFTSFEPLLYQRSRTPFTTSADGDHAPVPL